MDIKTFLHRYRAELDGEGPQGHHWGGVTRALERLETADGMERAILFDRLLLDAHTPSEQVWSHIERSLEAPDCRDTADLECFILQHRSRLDTEVPDVRVWEGIETALSVPDSRNRKPLSLPRPLRPTRHFSINILTRIAAGLALLLTGAGLGIWYAGGTSTQTMAMSEVSSEYAELERYYQLEIQQNQQKLANFAGYQPADVSDDLQQMDQVMHELREELASVPAGNREQVVRAMIENYEAKATVLRRVIEHLEKRDDTHSVKNTIQQHENL
jgi:spore coat protein CotF